jgi:8-amino-7-oxononanoate synthase
MEFLESHLAAHRHRFQRVMIVTESVFSMDGDCADLPKLADLARRYDCGLVVDEAHATGVYGRQGGGLLEETPLEVTERLPLLLKLGTLSKAVGGIGGFAAGDQVVIDFLVNRCRSYLFSTSPPAAAMAAAAAAIELLRGMDAERLRLRAMSRELRGRLREASLAVPQGDSPIVPIIVGSERSALHLSQRLSAAGIYVPAIRPPTVPAGTSRLRISLSALHSQEDIDRLLETLLEV